MMFLACAWPSSSHTDRHCVASPRATWSPASRFEVLWCLLDLQEKGQKGFSSSRRSTKEDAHMQIKANHVEVFMSIVEFKIGKDHLPRISSTQDLVFPGSLRSQDLSLHENLLLKARRIRKEIPRAVRPRLRLTGPLVISPQALQLRDPTYTDYSAPIRSNQDQSPSRSAPMNSAPPPQVRT